MRYRRYVFTRAAVVLAGVLLGLFAFLIYWFVLRPTEMEMAGGVLLRGLLLFLAAGLVLGAGGAVLLSLLLSQSLIRPLRELERDLTAISQGDLSVRMRSHFLQEIDGLSRAFNRMAEELSRRFGQISQTARQRRDLELAAQIQASAIPQKIPSHPTIDIAAVCHPTEEVGGDFYDLFQPDDRHVAIVLADIAAKGLQASLQIARLQGMLRAYLALTMRPAEALSFANRTLRQQAPQGAPVALFCAVLDLHEKNLVYANAGYPLPLIRYGDLTEQHCGVLDTYSAPLGTSPGTRYKPKSVVLSSGDVIVLYSDGLIEARNQAQEKFGAERLERLVTKQHRLDAQELLERIITEVNTFVGAAKRADDISLIVLKIKREVRESRLRRIWPRRTSRKSKTEPRAPV